MNSLINYHEVDFNKLISSIYEIDKNFVLQSKRAINVHLTLRNWFIGAYIYEYELNGSDRADYGDKLLFHIEKYLENLSNCNRRQLYEYIQFYKVYPQIVPTVSAQSENPLISHKVNIFEIVHTLCAQLTWSHIRLLISIDNDIKRDFYIEICKK